MPEAKNKNASHSNRAQRLVMLAVVAMMLLFVGLALLALSEGGRSTEAFRLEMTKVAAEGIEHDYLTEDFKSAKAWLDERGYPVPTQFARFPCIGCKTIDWGSAKIGCVSFSNDAGEAIHLFILDREKLNDLESVNSPLEQRAIHQGRATVGWLGENHAYLLVASEPEVELPQFSTKK